MSGQWKPGYLETLAFILAVLKVAGLIAISWWWIVAPFLVAFVLGVIVGIYEGFNEVASKEPAPQQREGLSWAKTRFTSTARKKNVPQDAIDMMVTSFPLKKWKTLADIDSPRAVAELQEWVDSL